MVTKSSLPTPNKGKLTVAAALGKLNVLAVGVSDYLCDFSQLKQCRTDAEEFADACRDVRQLNGDSENIVCMTESNSALIPTRGGILRRLQELAASATNNDRIIFYFSGHGTRLAGAEEHYLVPSDVYSGDDPDALISTEKVFEIMRRSRAKQKIVILDACLSGPSLNGAKHRALDFSEKFFTKQLLSTQGFALISSSSASELSYTKSDNPRLSLFTFYLLKGLYGDPDALDSDKILTISSLFEFVNSGVRRKSATFNKTQTPNIYTKSNGVMVLGDFRSTLISSAPIGLPNNAFGQVLLTETQSENVRALLPDWKDPRKTKDQLEYAANTVGALNKYFDDDFSSWRTELRTEFGFPPAKMEVGGGDLEFPGGSLCNNYVAESKERGFIQRKLYLEMEWMRDGARLKKLLEIFKFNVEEFVLELNSNIVPIDQLQGLAANNWNVKSEKDTKVVAYKDGIELRVHPKRIVISGLDFDEILDQSIKNSKSREIFSQAVSALTLPQS